MKNVFAGSFLVVLSASLLIFNQYELFPIQFNKPLTIHDSLKASIGLAILQGTDKRLAKSFDRVRKGDKFQIYIKSYSSSFIYILNNSDNGDQSLLFNGILKPDSLFIFPGKSSYYLFDGLQKKEKIIVIISQSRIPDKEISNYYSQIKGKYIVIASENVSLISKIIGTLRSVDDINNMKLYIGKEFIFKEFNFDVKK